MRWVPVAVAVALAGPAAAADPPAWAAEFDKARKEVEAAQKAATDQAAKDLKEAKSDLDKAKVFAAARARATEAARPRTGDLLAVLKPHAADPAAVDRLVWVLHADPAGPTAAEAVGLLTAHHAASPKVFAEADKYTYALSMAPWAEDVFRAVRKADVPRDRKAFATLALAEALARVAEPLAAIRANPPKGGKPADPGGFLAPFQDRDPAAMEAEAVALFKELVADYADVKGRRGQSVADRAKGHLYELEHLKVGKPAPDTEAEDLDGNKFKLSDYKGKVVALVFWASWCGPCMAAVPGEKKVVEHFKGRPFVLVGANGDPTKEAAKKAVDKAGIPWRSFWNGSKGPDGPVAGAWNVLGWPTVFLIDHEGVIRAKQTHGPALDMTAEPWVRKAEAAAAGK